MGTGFVSCILQDSFPNDTEIAADDIKSLFMDDFIGDVKTFGFEACFFEVVKGADEALIVRGDRGKWNVLFASNDFGSGTSASGGFKLSGYTSGRVMVVLNEGFEWDRWLPCSMEFREGGHGGD